MLGSLMMLASGVLASSPSSARASPTRCSSVQPVAERGDDPAGQRDVAGLDVHTGRGGVGLDDRQERVRRQHRRFVGVGVDDLGHARGALPEMVRGAHGVRRRCSGYRTVFWPRVPHRGARPAARGRAQGRSWPVMAGHGRSWLGAAAFLVGVDLAGDVLVATVDAGDHVVGRAGDRGADDRRHPEQPQLAGAPLPLKNATPVERAGLTEVLVIGMDTRWISVSASPMAIGAKPAGPGVGGAQDDVEEERGEEHLGARAPRAASTRRASGRRSRWWRSRRGRRSRAPLAMTNRARPRPAAGDDLGDDVGRHVRHGSAATRRARW